MDAVRSSELKFLRASEQLDQLRIDAEWYIKGGPASFAVNTDPQTGHKIWQITRLDHLPVKWKALAGDVLQNLRSALDHSVYELDMRPHGERDSDTRLCFPIFGWKPTDEYWRERIGSPRPGIEAVLKSYQPYERRKANPKSDPLYWLHHLARIDRHRRLHFAIWTAGEVTIRKGDTIIHSEPPMRLKVGTEIIRFDPSAPNADPNVQIELPLQVSFAEPPVRDKSVVHVLYEIRENVNQALKELRDLYPVIPP